MQDPKEMFKKSMKNRKNNEDKPSGFARFLFVSFIKTLIVGILFLGSLIYIKQNDANKENFKKTVYKNTLSFAKIYDIYNKYLGDVIPFKNLYKDNNKLVSNEKIIYQKIEKENNGYVLTVGKEYLASAIKSGIVVAVKKDNTYNNVIKIQDKNGLNITYGYLEEVNVKLYDYVEKGELLGKTNNKLFLMFEKDDKYLSYEGYI